MKHGIIYCRVSSKEQIEGTSLESQELACKEFARSKDIAIQQVFIGRGESAKFADRPELLQLLDYCRRHKNQIDALLVWKLDRLARNVNDHFNVKATLLKYGVQVISVTEPIDSKPEGKLLETILAGFAQFDNDVRAMRSVQGMRQKLQDGLFPWNPPLGYHAVAKREKKTAPDEPTQPVFNLLQKAWKTFATGAYTKAEMQRLMTNWGIVSRKGAPLAMQSIDYLFRNPYYAGIVVDPWSREEYEGKHRPMVTREEFARVQNVISGRSHAVAHHRERPEFPLRGTVRCHGCKKYMTSSFCRGRNGRYPYYHCHYGECSGTKYLAAARLHEEFRNLLAHITPKQELVDTLKQIIIEQAEERQGALLKNAKRLKEQASRLAAQNKELIRMRTQGLISDQEFLQEKAALSKQQFSLAAEDPPKAASIDKVHSQIEQITAPLLDLPATWERLPIAQKLRFQHYVVPAGFVAGESRTAALGRLFSVFRQFDKEKTNEVPLAGESWNQLLQEIRGLAELFDHSMDEEIAA
jgi:DNA invertase Pin-like site-specific DNA recombinase